MWLRQSTASQEILLGPFLDSTDGNTAETGLTIANTDIKVWKEGGTTESNKNSGGGTHIAGGRYSSVLNATDTNTLGKLEINCHVTGALAVRREFMVLPANVYDSLVLGTDDLSVEVASMASNVITGAATATDFSTELFTTNLTEAYRADGSEGSIAEILYEIISHLGESSISGVTKTITQIDGITTAATFTLNSATVPTSITRTT